MTIPIHFHFSQQESVQVYDHVNGYDSIEELKAATRAFFDDFQCPECNGHQCVGNYIGVVFRENRLCREQRKTRTTGIIFRKTEEYYENEYVRSVWRIDGFQLRQKDGGYGIFSDETEGYIKCNRKDCNWEMRGGTKPRGKTTQYMSVLHRTLLCT